MPRPCRSARAWADSRRRPAAGASRAEKDVIGFERGIGGEVRAPVAVRVLQRQQSDRLPGARPAPAAEIRVSCAYAVDVLIVRKSSLVPELPSQLRRQGEAHVFVDQFHFFQLVKTLVPQETNKILHQILGRGGSSGDRHITNAVSQAISTSP